MGDITENVNEDYDWELEKVYLIENDDYVEGGEDGVSNRQAKELTKRTRNLHNRTQVVELEISTLGDSILDIVSLKDEAVLRSSKEYSDTKKTEAIAIAESKDIARLNQAKTYADEVVARLVDSSPDALNTLQELAQALGNDPSFATTMINALAEKANKIHAHAWDAITDKPDVYHTGNFNPNTKVDESRIICGEVSSSGEILSGLFFSVSLNPYNNSFTINFDTLIAPGYSISITPDPIVGAHTVHVTSRYDSQVEFAFYGHNSEYASEVGFSFIAIEHRAG